MAHSGTLFQLLWTWGSAQRVPGFSSVLLHRVRISVSLCCRDLAPPILQLHISAQITRSVSWHCRALEATQISLMLSVPGVTSALNMALRGASHRTDPNRLTYSTDKAAHAKAICCHLHTDTIMVSCGSEGPVTAMVLTSTSCAEASPPRILETSCRKCEYSALADFGALAHTPSRRDASADLPYCSA